MRHTKHIVSALAIAGVGLALCGCYDENGLASANIASPSSSDPLPPALAAQNLLVVDDPVLITGAIEKRLGQPGAGSFLFPGPVLANYGFNGLGDTAGCTQDPENTCFQPVLAMENGDASTLSNWVGAALDINSYVIGRGVDLGQPDASLLPFSGLVVPKATLSFDGAPQVSRHYEYDDAGKAVKSDIGVWLPLAVNFPNTLWGTFGDDQPLAGDVIVDCAYFKAVPSGYLKQSEINAICGFLDSPALAGAPLGCPYVHVAYRINHLRMALGVVPSPNAHANGGAWTKSFFPGSKDFHLSDMPALDVRVVGHTGATEVEYPGSLMDTQSDISIGVHLECVSPIGAQACTPPPVGFGIDCDSIFTDYVADEMVNRVSASFNKALQDQLAPYLTFDEQPPQACASLVGCSSDQLTAFAKMSATYQKWDWFASPFGPYPNGSWLPVTAVDSQADLPDGSSATITYHFDSDVDGDGIINPLDPHWTCSELFGDE